MKLIKFDGSDDYQEQRLVHFNDVMDEINDFASAAYTARQDGTPQGPVTCIKGLNDAIGGALQPGLHVVHGAPGAGKTAFCLQTAATNPFPTLYVTCEMAVRELLFRQTARVLHSSNPQKQITLGRLKNGSCTSEQVLEYVRRGSDAAPHLSFLDATRQPVTLETIMEMAAYAKGMSPHLLIVVDSLHSWVSGNAGNMSEYEALNAGITGLRRLSHELNCPVLYIAERNRSSMRTGGQSAGAGTRQIEYGAETVFDMALDEDMQPDEDGKVSYPIKIQKNRNGASYREVQVDFHGAFQEFTEAR